jgi:hypothetical protein
MLLASHEVRYIVSLADSPLSERFRFSGKSKAIMRTKSPALADETHIRVTVRCKTDDKTDTEPFLVKPDEKDVTPNADMLYIKAVWSCEPDS